MESADHVLFLQFEGAFKRLRKLDDDIKHHLERLAASAAEALSPAVRDLAFFEGLRYERDEARQALTSAEQRLLEYLLKRLDSNSPSD
jgi:hypothetical protein